MIFIGILLNVTFNFIFIPKYGAIASAWTTLGSYVFLSITYIIYIQVKLPFNIPFGKLFKLLLVGGIFAGIFYGLSLTALPWWLVSGISGIALLGLTLGAGIVKFGKAIE